MTEGKHVQWGLWVSWLQLEWLRQRYPTSIRRIHAVSLRKGHNINNHLTNLITFSMLFKPNILKKNQCSYNYYLKTIFERTYHKKVDFACRRMFYHNQLDPRLKASDKWLLLHLNLFSVRFFFFQVNFGLKFSVIVRKLFTNNNEMQMTFLYIQLHISILLWKHSCQLLQQKLIDVVTHFVCPQKNICTRHTLI